MRAIAIERFGGREELQVMDVPDPLLGPDSVLVAVRGAGVNPVDAKIRQGALAGAIPHLFPLVPGWDAAGTVAAVGPAVTRFEVGQEVFGYFRKDFVRDGTYAELAAVRDVQLAPMPATLSFHEAAALPLAGLTAMQLLREGIDLQREETVLIHGAAGGVGGFAVQLAHDAGAHVIAVASTANHDHVRGLGADEVIDYHEQDFVAEVLAVHPDGIEGVIDLIGGETLARSTEVLRTGRGRVASVAEPPSPDAFAARGLAGRYIFVRPDADGLRQLGDLVDAGALRVHLADVIALEQAAHAHELIEKGHTRGKIVLSMDS